jgi:hypothetical protein
MFCFALAWFLCDCYVLFCLPHVVSGARLACGVGALQRTSFFSIGTRSRKQQLHYLITANAICNVSKPIMHQHWPLQCLEDVKCDPKQNEEERENQVTDASAA